MDYWRLPTIEELYWLYQNKKELFDEGCYWSSSENSGDKSWFLSFGWGHQSTSTKEAIRFVIPVRGSGDDLEVYPHDLGEMSWYEAMEACEKLNEVKIETATIPNEKITICFSGGQILEFFGRYRKDLEVKNWHYYQDSEGRIIHCRKSQMVYVVGGLQK